MVVLVRPRGVLGVLEFVLMEQQCLYVVFYDAVGNNLLLLLLETIGCCCCWLCGLCWFHDVDVGDRIVVHVFRFVGNLG
jgi:hypothetical protein